MLFQNQELRSVNINIEHLKQQIYKFLLIFLGESNDQLNIDDNSVVEQVLQEYDLGFKRRERLDVKKPGPPFDAQITGSKEVY